MSQHVQVAGGTDRLPSALAIPRPTLTGAVALLSTASLLAVGLASGSFRDPRGF